MSGDRCTEKGGSGGGGTVSEAMNKDQCLGFRQLWDIKIPPRALSFAWRLLWDRLPSKENLASLRGLVFHPNITLREYGLPMFRSFLQFHN